MGWEQRGSGRYYYAAERVGDRVVKRYLGFGPAGELAARVDALTRDERARAADAARRVREALESLDAALDPLNEVADALTTAALVAAGYHRPKRGPWRKRRV